MTLFITGGLRFPADFAKALALGADAIALSNSAIQAIGCIGMRACHTNNCPVGIATQKEHLRRRLIIEEPANRLKSFFEASVDLIRVIARACGHRHINEFESNNLTTVLALLWSIRGWTEAFRGYRITTRTLGPQVVRG